MESTMQLNAVPTFLERPFSKKVTNEVLMMEYLFYAENVRAMAQTTLKSRRIYLKQFLIFLESYGLKDISTLTNAQLDFYFVQLSKRQSARGRLITTGTVNTSKRAVRGFLTWCKLYKNIPLTANLSEIKENRREDTHPKVLTHDEILLTIKRIKNKQDRLIVSVMYEAGLRISEVADMKFEHLRGRTLDVVGKGKKHRITYVSASLASQLYKWMESNKWEDGYVFRPLQHGDGIGGYVNTDTIRQRLKRHFYDALGKDMHPHQLRHAFALRLLKSGCDLRSIQKMLGHSKIETTMAYLNIDDEHLEKEHARSFSKSVYVPTY